MDKTDAELLEQSQQAYDGGVVNERPEWIQESIAASLLVIARHAAKKQPVKKSSDE